MESGTGVALSIGAVLRGANTTREPTSDEVKSERFQEQESGAPK
jgi:hypothetical protein